MDARLDYIFQRIKKIKATMYGVNNELILFQNEIYLSFLIGSAFRKSFSTSVASIFSSFNIPSLLCLALLRNFAHLLEAL
jgi:hypothetical protein